MRFKNLENMVKSDDQITLNRLSPKIKFAITCAYSEIVYFL